ncbi:MAG: PIN domain-containing protein [Chloroflexota bacterium]|nr:PIN domain-containing protein [Chloroflexota bacterium]
MRFVDTSFWVALGLQRDGRHQEARAIWTEDSVGAFLTTNHVVGETWTFLRRRAGHEAAVRFIDQVERSRRVGIIHVDAAAEAEALSWLRRHDERTYSFVAATSFVVMRQNRLAEALAFDGDFTAAGFVEVRP